MSTVKTVARWTGPVEACAGGGFVAYGDYLELHTRAERLEAALRELVELKALKLKYAAAQPCDPRHAGWEAYVEFARTVDSRTDAAWASARSALDPK